MCLISKNRFPKIALHDIVCYKVIASKKCENGDTKYFTPIQHKEIGEKQVKNGKPIKGVFEGSILPHKRYYSLFEIEDGYIHTYKNKAHAYVTSVACNFVPELKDSGINYHVFEAIIPFGTLYYEGLESIGYDCYASRKIKLKTEIE